MGRHRGPAGAAPARAALRPGAPALGLPGPAAGRRRGAAAGGRPGPAPRPRPSPEPTPGPSQTPVTGTPGLQAAALGSSASLGQAEADYRRATEQLLESLRSGQGSLPPGTLETVEKNLSDIDRALGEIRAALESDPENAQLARLLNGTQRRKLQMLQSVARLTRT